MWKRHRRIVGPAMHRRYLSRMTAHVSASANALVNLWNAKLEIAGNDAFVASPDIKLATMVSPSKVHAVEQLLF
jgi:cytochrome P450